MDEHYTIEEVAFALETSLKTILRRLQSGEMKGVKCGKSWLIPKAALKDWIFAAIGIPSQYETCKKDDQNGIITEQNRGQTSGVSWYRYRDTPNGVASTLTPQQAAVLLQKRFRYQAKRLLPNDPMTQWDLVQEMSLAVLNCDAAASRSYFMQRARSRALNYLKRERRRGRVPLGKLKLQVTIPEPVTDVGLCRLLVDAGIPVAEMAEATGMRISPDVELDRLWMKEKVAVWKGGNESVLESDGGRMIKKSASGRPAAGPALAGRRRVGPLAVTGKLTQGRCA